MLAEGPIAGIGEERRAGEHAERGKHQQVFADAAVVVVVAIVVRVHAGLLANHVLRTKSAGNIVRMFGHCKEP
jgi:hypothetical protein